MKHKLVGFSLLSLLLGLCAVTGCSERHLSADYRYDILGMDEFPIGMWVTPSDNFMTDDAYRGMAECGINFVNGFGYHENSPEKIFKAMDLCEKYGMKYFVNRRETLEGIKAFEETGDSNIVNKFISEAQLYSEHPAYAGELLMDEPGKPLFGSLSAFVSAYERNIPEGMWHVNLFPTYATGGIRTFSYEDYIESWLDIIDPGYISYDSYPLLKEGANIIPDYFYNLDYIRANTMSRHIPFWTFIQTLSIAQTPGVPDKREPEESDIRWQVWTNLIFGAKGIQYFCYWSPGNGTELFSDALVSVDGKKTNKYDYVRSLNEDIHPVADVLLYCDAMGVIQNARNEFRLYAPMEAFGPLYSVSGDDSITGCFVGPDGHVRFLVAPQQPGFSAKVNLQFDDAIEELYVMEYGKGRRVKVNKSISFDIPAGEAVFVEVIK